MSLTDNEMKEIANALALVLAQRMPEPVITQEVMTILEKLVGGTIRAFTPGRGLEAQKEVATIFYGNINLGLQMRAEDDIGEPVGEG